MPRTQTRYICQQCGSQYPQAYGRCPGCGSWNSLVETLINTGPGTKSGAPHYAAPAIQQLTQVESSQQRRIRVPLEEFNRVLGGGIVPGSLVLIGGDPGIGKSTLLLQVSEHIAAIAGDVLYATGEESAEQVKLRADRLGAVPTGLFILPETHIDAIVTAAATLRPQLLVIDSIQTMECMDLASPAGSVGQIRECTSRLLRLAKGEGIATIIVGHVTKEGSIAGPKVLEHMVDTVLYLEGDRFHAYRLLRSVKNRFGATNEIGVFDMQDGGLVEVTNPSAFFLANNDRKTSGSAIAVTLEGTRPLLVELQALCTPTHFGLPRRTANGIDLNRLLMLTAVLSKRTGLRLANQDIYVNVAGGLKLVEPAADLATVAAIASSVHDTPLPEVVVCGEVGLGGEVRPVQQMQRRLLEAKKLGFTHAIVAQRNARELDNTSDIRVEAVNTVEEALRTLGLGV
jgi:DNA repair protein RadA/Sms